MVRAGSVGRIGGQNDVADGRAAHFARVVGALAQPFQGPVNVVEHLRRLCQFGFVALFHRGKSTAGVSGVRILRP